MKYILRERDDDSYLVAIVSFLLSMVLMLNGNSEKGAHMWNKIGNQLPYFLGTLLLPGRDLTYLKKRDPNPPFLEKDELNGSSSYLEKKKILPGQAFKEKQDRHYRKHESDSEIPAESGFCEGNDPDPTFQRNGTRIFEFI